MSKKKTLIIGGILLALTLGALTTLKPQHSGSKTPEKQQTIRTDAEPSADLKAAIQAAEIYLKAIPLSKEGLYDQLISASGETTYTEAVARAAVNKVKADYQENALKKGEEYAKTMFLSKQAIYHQLSSDFGEKFTAKEAQYAIDHLKVDYKINALEKAKRYLKEDKLSKADIKKKLLAEDGDRFTEEEVNYALEQLD